MKILNFGQMLHVGNRKFEHQFMVVTDDGRSHLITTNEATIQQLIDAMTAPPLQATAQVAQEPFDDAAIFGGEEDPGEVSSPVMGTVSPEPSPAPPPPAPGIGQKKARSARVLTDADGFALPVPVKSVPKDSMGYPIVKQTTAPSLVPEDDGNEDGAQI